MKLTPENAKAVIPLLQAVAEGKVLQAAATGNAWVDFNGPIERVAESPRLFRIKPEPRVIWVNEYPEGEFGFAYASQDEACGNARRSATRIAVRYVEDTTNGK